MSLVKEFKKVTEHIKLTVKSQFIDILEQAQMQANFQVHDLMLCVQYTTTAM